MQQIRRLRRREVGRVGRRVVIKNIFTLPSLVTRYIVYAFRKHRIEYFVGKVLPNATRRAFGAITSSLSGFLRSRGIYISGRAKNKKFREEKKTEGKRKISLRGTIEKGVFRLAERVLHALRERKSAVTRADAVIYRVS